MVQKTPQNKNTMKLCGYPAGHCGHYENAYSVKPAVRHTRSPLFGTRDSNLGLASMLARLIWPCANACTQIDTTENKPVSTTIAMDTCTYANKKHTKKA